MATDVALAQPQVLRRERRLSRGFVPPNFPLTILTIPPVRTSPAIRTTASCDAECVRTRGSSRYLFRVQLGYDFKEFHQSCLAPYLGRV